MLGYEQFILERKEDIIVLMALDKDESTIWFDVQTTFPDVSRIAYRKGKYRQLMPHPGKDMFDNKEPRIFFDGEAAAEAAKSMQDEELLSWIQECVQYYECPNMDWTMFTGPLDA